MFKASSPLNSLLIIAGLFTTISIPVLVSCVTAKPSQNIRRNAEQMMQQAAQTLKLENPIIICSERDTQCTVSWGKSDLSRVVRQFDCYKNYCYPIGK